MRQFANRSSLISVALYFGVLCSGAVVRAQSSGTIFGTLAAPGSRDSNWTIVALPSGFTPPDSQTTPYAAYVPTNVDGNFLGGGSPQTGYTYGDDTIYWIAPQNSTNSLVGGTYNWIAQQQFTVPTTGFYRFDFPGAGDDELDFYIGGAINTTDPLRPTITGGQQIGNRAGTFTAISTFTGGAQLSAGTYTASMVLWDYGGSTGAMIGTSTFGPAVAYWAPATGAGGNGTWNNANVFWAPAADGSGTKGDWTQAVGVAYFGGTAGTVSVGEDLAVNQMYFTTGGYVVQDNALSMGSGGTITSQSGLATISSTLNPSTNLKIAGSGTVALAGTTNIGFGRELIVDGGNLLVNGVVTGGFGTTNVSTGSLGGTGVIGGSIRGGGRLDPGPTGGNAGILATNQLNPSDGLDFTLFYNGTTPTYGNLSDSGNDMLRITANPQFTAPFTSALTSANTKTLFLNMTEAELTLGTVLEGGFFTDAAFDFTSFLNNQAGNNAGFQVYVLGDGNGTDNSYNGQGYYNWRNPDMFGWDQSLFMSTTPRTANFGSGNVNGQVMLLTVAVPEPSTVALGAVAGLGGLAALRRRRRRT